MPPQVIHHIADFIRSEFSQAERAELIVKLKSYCETIISVPGKYSCPFLDESNSCSIYSHRPPACRAFTSTDPALCMQSVSTGSQVPQSPVTLRIYEALTTALMAKAQQNNQHLIQMPFIPALYNALN